MIEQTALRYFIAVAVAKSIRKASDRLRISQSAVSRQIMLLEADLGFPLFKRLTKGVELTAAGEMFLRYANHNATQVRRLKEEIKNTEVDRLHRIRIAVTNSLTYHVLPSSLVRLRAMHPEVTFEVLVATEAEMLEWLLKKEIDIAVTYRTPKTAIVREVFFQDLQMQAVARASHRLATLRSVSVADLSSTALALPTYPLRIRQIIDDAASREGVKLVPTFESNSTQFRMSLALQADAVALVLGGMCVLENEYEGLVPIDLKKGEFASLPIAAFISRETKPTPAIETFLDTVEKVLRDCVLAGYDPRGHR